MKKPPTLAVSSMWTFLGCTLAATLAVAVAGCGNKNASPQQNPGDPNNGQNSNQAGNPSPIGDANQTGNPNVTAANCTVDQATTTTNVALSAIQFSPQCVTVAVGSTVTFSNNDTVTHTVTSATSVDSFTSGDLSAGSTFDYTFDNVGTISVFCNYHSSMHLTVIVQ